MSYPNIRQLANSTVQPTDHVQLDRSSNGTLRGRFLWNSYKHQFQVEHIVDAAGLQTLIDFYVSNRTTSFDFVWSGDNNTYRCMFDGPPEQFSVGAGNWRVISKLVEV